MQANINCLVFRVERRQAKQTKSLDRRRWNAFCRCCVVSSRFMLVLWDKNLFFPPPRRSFHGEAYKKWKCVINYFMFCFKRHYAHGGRSRSNGSFMGFSSLTRKEEEAKKQLGRQRHDVYFHLGCEALSFAFTLLPDPIHGACLWLHGFMDDEVIYINF